MSVWPAALAVALLPVVWPRPARHVMVGPPVATAPADEDEAAEHREDVLSVAAALELIALALASGVPLVIAVEEVAARSGPQVGGHLRQVVAALRWGVEDAAAWEGLPEVWQTAGHAVALAGMAGVPPAGLVARAAADLRRAELRRIEEATGRLSVLVVIPLGLCFLPAFALLAVVPVIAALASDLLAGAG